jgi:hypothetical protein
MMNLIQIRKFGSGGVARRGEPVIGRAELGVWNMGKSEWEKTETAASARQAVRRTNRPAKNCPPAFAGRSFRG